MTDEKGFVAINYIDCDDTYRDRFEQLFATRAHAIDRMNGFRNMEVLKPSNDGSYLIVSYWDSESDFKKWTGSPEFLEGHKRGFEDIAEARAKGIQPPMRSSFKTYTIISK